MKNKIILLVLTSLLMGQDDLSIYTTPEILDFSVTEDLRGETYYLSDLKGTEIIIERYFIRDREIITVESNNPRTLNLLESLTEFDDIQTDNAVLRETIWRLDEFNSGYYFRYPSEDYGQVRQDTTLWD